MKTHFRTLISAIMAGVSIGIGGAVFLSVESKVLGAFLFTIGLFLVCTFKLHLYTGKVCYLPQQKPADRWQIITVWIGNLIGTVGFGSLLLCTRNAAALTAKAAALCQAKLNDDLLSIFVLAACCNVLIYIGVEGFLNNPHEVGRYLALFFGVVVFILCGFEHCVANMVYFTVGRAWSLKAAGYLLVMTLGNAVGGLGFAAVHTWLKKTA